MEQVFYAWHTVTERPMALGAHIRFDENTHNGVFRRVNALAGEVEGIYADPARYAGAVFDHSTAVALRELAMEEVRREEFPGCPSRLACLYVSQTREEAEKWAELFLSMGRPVLQIVRLGVHGRVFRGDANNCFEGTADREKNLALARHYWQNGPGPDEEPIWEMLADGDIEVLEIVKTFPAP